MEISNDINYVGVDDCEIDLFEGQYEVPLGMAYNSYVISDDKTAVFDAVDARFGDEWIENIKGVLGDRSPDYFIVLHMEPDHSANIVKFMNEYPKTVIVATAKAFGIMKNFYRNEYEDRRIVVADGDELSLGKHTLKFITAPMVHWPEVMVAYDSYEKVLFSADAFGKFGANGNTDPEGWDCEARRYYFGIVGKYGVQVQQLLKKLAGTELNMICPLHGPVLTENIEYYIDKYNTWSSYEVESEGVFIAYTSVYGHTKEAAEILAQRLKDKGCPRVSVADLARDDMFECVEDAFRHGKLVLATTTYNGDIFPFMRTFIEHLKERNYQKRTVAFIENGSWAPMCAKIMRGLLEGCKDLTFAENGVRIMSALTAENVNEIDVLAEELR